MSGPHYFFPRGEGPLVSVMIPTRGRPKDLVQAVDSLHSLAHDKSSMEFIFKADNDDPETVEVIDRIGSLVPVKKIVSPRGNGFHDMHLWVNQMCSLATGDWLYLWNDDARMVTEEWDKRLLLLGTALPWIGMSDACLIVTPTMGRPLAQEFVMIRRRTYEILGHFSQSPHNDNWIFSLMKFMEASLTVDIWVDHLSDRMDDETRKQSVEAYKTTGSTLSSLWAKYLKVEDAKKLLAHFEAAAARMVWRDHPEEEGWYWLEAEGKRECVLVENGRVAFFNIGEVVRLEEVSAIKGRWCIRK